MNDQDKLEIEKAQQNPSNNLKNQQKVNQGKDKNLEAIKTKKLKRGNQADKHQSTRVKSY